MMRHVIASLFAVLLWGCATHVQHAQPSVQGPYDDPVARIEPNKTNIHCSYSPEWKFNRGNKDTPPAVGLALSGGGMRAGSYSVGALSALSELGVLGRTDVISAASGGAYAAGWYVTQKVAADAQDSDLFRDCVPSPTCPGYQHHLATHGRIINRRRTAFAFVTDAVMFPINLLVNGAFGWHENTTGHRRFYERALISEFFTEPGTQHHLRYSFPELLTASKAKNLPLLIINTTASLDDDAHHHGADFRNSVYELSPVRYGSDAFGFRSDTYPVDLPRAVSVSGAAADLSVLASGNVQKTLFSALNLDLGYFVDNRLRFTKPSIDADGCVHFDPVTNAHFRARKWAFRAIPFPAYPFIPYWAKDARGLRTYLSDGGHSENLGAFTLIRRLVQNIVIVDASGDPNFEFGDYMQLREGVRRDLGATLTVPAIDAALLLNTEDRRRTISATPVMTGRVRYFPYPNRPDNVRELNIVYIKLSYDTDHAATAYAKFPNVISYYERHPKKFPFQGLFDQSYSPDQYRAYRDLAYATIMNARAIIEPAMTP